MAFFFLFFLFGLWEVLLFGTESCVSIGGIHGVQVDERERKDNGGG